MSSCKRLHPTNNAPSELFVCSYTLPNMRLSAYQPSCSIGAYTWHFYCNYFVPLYNASFSILSAMPSIHIKKEIERKRKLRRGWRLSVSPHLGPPRLKFWPLLLSSSNFMHFNAHLPFKWSPENSMQEKTIGDLLWLYKLYVLVEYRSPTTPISIFSFFL